jgi:hypothetical protein
MGAGDLLCLCFAILGVFLEGSQCVEVPLRGVSDVVPQWLPLLFLVPHVRPLEHRNNVLNVKLKKLLKSSCVCEHFPLPD